MGFEFGICIPRAPHKIDSEILEERVVLEGVTVAERAGDVDMEIVAVLDAVTLEDAVCASVFADSDTVLVRASDIEYVSVSVVVGTFERELLTDSETVPVKSIVEVFVSRIVAESVTLADNDSVDESEAEEDGLEEMVFEGDNSRESEPVFSAEAVGESDVETEIEGENVPDGDPERETERDRVSDFRVTVPETDAEGERAVAEASTDIVEVRVGDRDPRVFVADAETFDDADAV